MKLLLFNNVNNNKKRKDTTIIIMKYWGKLLYYAFTTPLSLHSSRKIVRQNWFPRHEFPCPNIKWTCEHIVPKSIIPEHNDLHNLILLPDRLNSCRSNYPYVNGIGFEDINNPLLSAKIIKPCMAHDCSCFSLQGKLVSNKVFIPSDRFKGMIGRSVLFMKDKYPHHEERIHTRVLDLGTASIWNYQFPPSSREIKWNQWIYSYQGDSNPYVISPINRIDR